MGGRNREPFSNLVLYRFLKWSVIMPIFRGYLRGQVYGIEHVPRTGAVIVVSNHASHFDPPLLSVAVRRPIAYMAKEELFRVPGLSQLIQLYGAYPVKRQAVDRAAIRAAIHKLEQGWGIGIFLSGTRTLDGRITDPKLGAAMIAAKQQVPLLPVSLWGTELVLPKGSKFPRSVPVTIRIGELIDPPQSGDRPELERVTGQCVEAIHALHDLKR